MGTRVDGGRAPAAKHVCWLYTAVCVLLLRPYKMGRNSLY